MTPFVSQGWREAILHTLISVTRHSLYQGDPNTLDRKVDTREVFCPWHAINQLPKTFCPRRRNDRGVPSSMAIEPLKLGQVVSALLADLLRQLELRVTIRGIRKPRSTALHGQKINFCVQVH
jgi:hypothetical protein